MHQGEAQARPSDLQNPDKAAPVPPNSAAPPSDMKLQLGRSASSASGVPVPIPRRQLTLQYSSSVPAYGGGGRDIVHSAGLRRVSTESKRKQQHGRGPAAQPQLRVDWRPGASATKKGVEARRLLLELQQFRHDGDGTCGAARRAVWLRVVVYCCVAAPCGAMPCHATPQVLPSTVWFVPCVDRPSAACAERP